MSTAELLDRLDAVVAQLQALDAELLTDDEVVEIARRTEAVKRRLVPVDHVVLNQLSVRSVPFNNGCRTTTVFVSQLLRISRAEASARVNAAELLGSRRTLTGEPVPPQFPAVAAAQRDGVLSDRHAAVITRCIDRLPDEVGDQFGEWLEQTLVEHGRHLDPTVLERHARQLAYRLDQDGPHDEAKHRDKTRGFDVHVHADGSSHGEFHLTAECTAHLLATFDALTKPSPSTEAGPDPRSATQRRHDAFQQMLQLVERAELLPNAGGVSTTVILTLEADSWVRGTGTATTGHGYTIPAETARRWTNNGFDARFMVTLLTKTKAVEAYSSAHRIFTEGQRLAMIARDQGCTYPGCDAGPAWCQAHHVTDWAAGGATSISNATLACCGDHRDHQAMGWHATMLNGVPHWVPPKWLDPDQEPRRNTRHDPLVR